MVRQAKWRCKGPARLKCDLGKIGYARRKSFDVSFGRAKGDAVVGVCRSQYPQVSLVEGKMHVVKTEEVENLDFQRRGYGPAFRRVGPCQAAPIGSRVMRTLVWDHFPDMVMITRLTNADRPNHGGHGLPEGGSSFAT